MKIVLTCVLTFIGLAFANDYTLKIKNDGSTIQGGTVHYVAELFDGGLPASGSFRYEWVDDTIAQHSTSHECSSNKDEWAVSYEGTDPGSYTAVLTVKKLVDSVYVPIASEQSSLSITKHLHGAFLVSTEVSDTNYIATHTVVLTTPSAKYLEDKGASITTYWYVDGFYYASTNGLVVIVKYPKIYRRIGVQALVVAQLDGRKKTDDSYHVYSYIENEYLHPVINHYTECNASFPFVDVNNDHDVKENAILGCFTRTFRLWDSLFPENIPWHQPLTTYQSLDGINFAREKVLNSQRWELDRITDPFVRSIVANRIDAINQKVPILSAPNPIDYSTLEARMERLKEGEKMGLDRITDPFVRSVVEQRMNEGNKKIPHLTRTHNEERLSKSLREIEKKLHEIENAQKIKDPVVREAILNRIKHKYSKLSMRAIEVDARIKEHLDNIHKRKNSHNGRNSEDDKAQQHVRNRSPNLQKSNVFDTKVEDVSKGIENLKNAEKMAVDRIEDPTIKSIVIDRIHEQNKKIPKLLKSNAPDAGISGVLDAIHSKINDEIQRSSDISFEGISDPAIKEAVINKIDARNQILKEKSEEIDKTLEIPLSEISKRIKDLKETENSAIENTSDPDAKEDVISTIDKENEKIPVLMLPMVMEKNFSFVLDLIRSKMGGLIGNEALITRNVTDPIVQAMVASKFDKVNYILNSKFNMLSNGFSSILNKVTEGVDEPDAEIKKTPVLTKSLDSEVEDLDFPASLASNFSVALDAINDKINSFKDTTNLVTQNISIPAIQALVAAKLDQVSTLLNTKYKELSSNFTTIIDTITSKLANATMNVSKPSSKKIPKLGLSLDSGDEVDFDPTELIENYTEALDTLRTRIDDLQDSQDDITQNITNPFVQAIVASKLNTVNYILNSKYKLLNDNFTNFLNTIFEQKAKFINIPKLSLPLDLTPDGNSAALDFAAIPMANLTITTDVITENITDPAVKALVASKLDKVNTILSTKYQQLSDSFTTIIDMINSKLANASFGTSKKTPKKVPKLSLSADAADTNDLSDSSEIITNFTTALDDIRTKIDDLKNSQDEITQNITNPFAQAIVASKLNTVNYILNSKYKLLNDNYTNFLNTIFEQKAKFINIPKLSMPLDLTPDGNFSVALDFATGPMANLTITTDVITENITDPAVKALVASKLDKVNTILSTKYQQLSDSFTGIIDMINSKLTNASFGISKKKPKKVPKLSLSADAADTNDLSDPSEIITNFTIALDAIRTRIDDLKNSEDVITQNITNPFAQAIVATKLDRINFILKTKYKQLNDNFTNIMDTINAKLADASENESVPGARAIPKLTKTSGDGLVVDAVRTRITGKLKPADATVKFIKNPAAREIVMNKIIEENKNLSTIADKVEANISAALEEVAKKAKDLNTLEDLTVDYLDDPDAQAAFISQIDQANENIPLLSITKHDTKSEDSEPVQYTPPKSIFRMKYPTVIRF